MRLLLVLSVVCSTNYDERATPRRSLPKSEIFANLNAGVGQSEVIIHTSMSLLNEGVYSYLVSRVRTARAIVLTSQHFRGQESLPSTTRISSRPLGNAVLPSHLARLMWLHVQTSSQGSEDSSMACLY